jgi:hypothetical protein
VDVPEVAVGDAGDRDVVDVQLVALDQVQQQVHRPVVDVQFDPVLTASVLALLVPFDPLELLHDRPWLRVCVGG